MAELAPMTDDALAEAHTILDRFAVPADDDLLARLRTILQIRSKKVPKRTSAEIDALPPSDASRFWTIYGMQIRGLLGDVIDRIVITHRSGVTYHAYVSFRASCVDTGVPHRAVIFEGDVDVREPGTTVDGAMTLTAEQAVIRSVLYEMLMHEFREDLRIDGIPLYHTHPRRLDSSR